MCLKARFGLQVHVSAERADGQKALPIRARGLVGRGTLRAPVFGAGAGKAQPCPLVSTLDMGPQVPLVNTASPHPGPGSRLWP